METLLNFIEAQQDYDLTFAQLAYILATVKHETGGQFKPIYEYGRRDYFNKYDPPTRLAKRLGNVKKGYGYLYRGRGYVQVTGRNNYKKLSEVLCIDLISNPDLALDDEVAGKILLHGMMQGLFTGHSLGMYVLKDNPDFIQARRVVNGMDKAELIAGYAEEFFSMLQPCLF